MERVRQLALMKSIRRHWFSVMLYVALSAFFLSVSVISTNTYSAVVKAQKDVTLSDPTYQASLSPDGTIHLNFSIKVVNPSRYALHASVVSWYVKLINETASENRETMLGSGYSGPTSGVTVPAKSTKTFAYNAYVSDPAIISRLSGFINYSASLGRTYALDTLPYTYEFDFIASIGEFEHEYLRERYLNDLVTIELAYPSEEAQ